MLDGHRIEPFLERPLGRRTWISEATYATARSTIVGRAFHRQSVRLPFPDILSVMPILLYALRDCETSGSSFPIACTSNFLV